MRTFNIRYDIKTGKWVKDPKGPFVGHYDRFGKLVREEERKNMSLSTRDLELGTPALGVVSEEEE